MQTLPCSAAPAIARWLRAPREASAKGQPRAAFSNEGRRAGPLRSSTTSPPNKQSVENRGQGHEDFPHYESVAHLSAGEHDFRLDIGLWRDLRRGVVVRKP